MKKEIGSKQGSFFNNSSFPYTLLDLHDSQRTFTSAACVDHTFFSLLLVLMCYVIYFQVNIFEGKGRGVVAAKPFEKGDFVVEYSGELIDIVEAKNREQNYAEDQKLGCYMYYFKHKGQQYW